ncbi:thiamine phosphate synthase [Clostridium guangxiense]|uniref:thiamine phosphate synthase n=1 Tax=Clostridium guangxiense TaxID=1662055 RepID=UPI001E5F9433|nr:thiamine phosphate synthase [Clostridium guangxiense]MCD2346667.1 thiamine phosphate synthase [Clostridium guangxiense]
MIYVVTNRKLVVNGNLCDRLEKALEYGAKNIILREKDLKYDELYELACKIKVAADKYDARLIVNGNLRVAEEIKAYAYHMGFENFMRQEKVDIKIGVSVHSLEEAIKAEKNGAAYLLCGNVYETVCKPGLKGKGLDYIRKIVAKVAVPVIAIGGISEKNVRDVIEAGAKGVAIMSSAMKEPLVVEKLLREI